MDDREKIAQQMRSDWDRRVAHDYRFWMSDGHQSDQVMFQSGERDFDILMQDLEISPTAAFLELGCGVGRLLHAALKRFSTVTGVDVSQKAIQKAEQLLPKSDTLQLVCGDGYSLGAVPSKSIDVLISYAALTSIPTDIIASYLVEMNRVLTDDGTIRLQVYLGTEHIVGQNDTLHLRCYDQENFRVAVAAAGFHVEWMRELQLPFKVSFEELGIHAMIVSLKKNGVVPEQPELVSKLLLPHREATDWDEGKASEIESYMALTYAQQLVDQGDYERARDTLEMVAHRTSSLAIDIRDLLDRIVDTVQKKGAAVPSESPILTMGESAIKEKNLEILMRRFPKIAERMISSPSSNTGISIRRTDDGLIIECEGQCLDHPQKPKSAGEIWAKRLLAEQKIEAAEKIVIYGLGAGYHLRSLLSLTNKPVALIEPRFDVFSAAVAEIDLSVILERLVALEVGPDIASSIFSADSELTLRPQSVVVSSTTAQRVKAAFYGARGLSSLHPKIAVLGPLQGGTLPITRYCTRGLFSLAQRTREIDMSGFATSFHNLANFTKDRTRLATSQGQYIEMLSQIVLDSIIEQPVDVLLCMAQAPLSGRALSELRKRGVITALWFVEDYERFTYWKSTAQYFDFVFTIQRGACIDLIQKAGAGEVHYLPTGCDPMVHMPLQLSPEERARWGAPYSFVGAGYHNRQQVFASFAELPFKIWGTEWPTCRPFDKLVQEEGRRLSPEEYIKIFNATDININLHSSTERDGIEPYGDFVNPRTFELAATGAFQLVDSRSLLPEVFTPGKEIVTFDTVAELREKMEYYRAHPAERRAIADAGRERALREHTYGHRLRDMLSIIYSSKYEKLRAREDANPWKRVLERSKKDQELHQRCVIAHQRGEEANLDGLVSDIVTGKGKLTETEQKLLFLFHVRKQIIRMKEEEMGVR